MLGVDLWVEAFGIDFVRGFWSNHAGHPDPWHPLLSLRFVWFLRNFRGLLSYCGCRLSESLPETRNMINLSSFASSGYRPAHSNTSTDATLWYRCWKERTGWEWLCYTITHERVKFYKGNVHNSGMSIVDTNAYQQAIKSTCIESRRVASIQRPRPTTLYIRPAGISCKIDWNVQRITETRKSVKASKEWLYYFAQLTMCRHWELLEAHLDLLLWDHYASEVYPSAPSRLRGPKHGSEEQNLKEVKEYWYRGSLHASHGTSTAWICSVKMDIMWITTVANTKWKIIFMSTDM